MTTAIVVATIEYADGRVEYKTYRRDNSTITKLKAAIKRTLAKDTNVVHVACGNGIYQNSYGAH